MFLRHKTFSMMKWKQYNIYIYPRNLTYVSNSNKFYEFTTVHDCFSRRSSVRCYYRILFFGNDKFSEESLRALRISQNSESHVSSLEVVTNKAITGNCVLSYAQENGLTVRNWPCDVEENKFDVGVIVSFGHLMPRRIIQAFPWGMLNVHASLLPRWRGSAPVAHCIFAGDKQTGVSIMKIAEKRFDTGNILMQEKYDIPDSIRTPELTDRLAKMGATLLVECLRRLKVGASNSIPQDRNLVTKAPKIIPSMGLIKWDESTIHDVDCRFRALQHCIDLYTYWKGTKLKLFDMMSPKETCEIDHRLLASIEERQSIHPGWVVYHKQAGALCFRCRDGWIAFRLVHIAGKKTMKASDFKNGFLTKCSKDQQFCINKEDN